MNFADLLLPIIVKQEIKVINGTYYWYDYWSDDMLVICHPYKNPIATFQPQQEKGFFTKRLISSL